MNSIRRNTKVYYFFIVIIICKNNRFGYRGYVKITWVFYFGGKRKCSVLCKKCVFSVLIGKRGSSVCSVIDNYFCIVNNICFVTTVIVKIISYSSCYSIVIPDRIK